MNFISQTMQGHMASRNITVEKLLLWSLRGSKSNWFQNKNYSDSKADECRILNSNRMLLKEPNFHCNRFSFCVLRGARRSAVEVGATDHSSSAVSSWWSCRCSSHKFGAFNATSRRPRLKDLLHYFKNYGSNKPK